MRRTSRALSFILSAILLISLCPDRVSADDQILITEQPCDINIIPDKYNTGTKGELIKFTGETEQYGKKTVVSEEGVPIIFKKAAQTIHSY